MSHRSPAAEPAAAQDALPEWAVTAIVAAGQRMDGRGWVPATAGNLSVRLTPDAIAITRSGNHKGFLRADALMRMGVDGRPRSPGKPSAEAELHCQLYRHLPEVGAVLHGHSVAATVLSMREPADALPVQGYEVQKAFAGQATHTARLFLPIFDNDQDIGRLAARIAPLLPGMTMGYLLRGHGAYVWGEDMDRALARLEALEFLLQCELERRKICR